MIWNDRLRQLREQSGYTLKEIAGKLGVSEAMVSRHESSTKNIPHYIIEKYARIYGCTPSYIIGWDNAAIKVLVEDEIHLLTDYRMLNAEGKKMIKARMHELELLGYRK